MKRFLAILTIALFSVGMVRADEGKPMTNAGNSAWLFTFQGLSNFGIGGLFSVGGTSHAQTFGVINPGVTPAFSATSSSTVPGVGLRYYLANNLGLRGGLGLGILSRTDPNTETTLPDTKTSGFLLGVQAILECHMTGLAAISPYIGGGLGFQTGSFTVTTYSDQTNNVASKTSTTTINILAVAGFEWFFANRVSLGGEYQLGLGLNSSSTTNTPSTGSSTSLDGPSSTAIGTNAFSVILSLYP